MNVDKIKKDSLLVNSQIFIKTLYNQTNLIKQFKLIFILTFFFTLTIFFLRTANADVISLNAGGSQEIALTSDKYVEGFFSALNSDPVCGDRCDDGNTASGDGYSSTCQTETSTTPSSGGGGGGGEVTVTNIAVTPTDFNINMIINTTTERTIRVTNLGASSMAVVVSQSGLGNHIILTSNSLLIPAGGFVDLNVVFVALSESGVFTGKIIIGGKEVLVALNVKTQFLLFDSNIVVLNKDVTVVQGGELRTLLTLIPLGDPERLDVTINFAVKDYTNKVYLTKSETLLVDKLTELRRNFDTGLLPLGDYIIGAELVYPNGVAPSSAHFRVVEKKPISIFGRIVLYLVIMILVVSILIIIILIWRRRKKKKEATTREEI